MKKQWIAVFIACCLLLSGCSFSSATLPNHDDSSLPEPPYIFTPKPVSTENSEAEPPFEFTPAPKPTSRPTPTMVPTPEPSVEPVVIKEECSMCEGTGECFSCGGDGSGYGDEQCLMCYHDGDGKCFMCGGYGYTTYVESPEEPLAPGVCAICRGSSICQVCFGQRGLYVPTYGQDGEDWVDCSGCDGTGDCDYCNGTGKD